MLILVIRMAKLYFFYGAMNSGKTTRILQCNYNYEEQGMRAIIMKPATDTKGNDKIVSRIGATRKVDYLIKKDENIFDLIINEYGHVDLILVDEAQFLTTRQVNQLMDIVIDLDIPVMCYGLRTDFNTHLFEGSKRLLELADDIDEIKISCSCGRKAIINARVNDDGYVITDGEQILIGGNDRYIPLCRKCYSDAIKFNLKVKEK